MIIEAQRFQLGTNIATQVIDVLVNPATLIAEINENWKATIGMAFDSAIRAGYWTRDGIRLRLATREEIEQQEAFIKVYEITVDLNGE